MGGFAAAMLALRHAPNANLVMYVLITVWATDIGAYVTGRVIGGPKLAPSISPNKTWAGLLGGMLCAALCSYVFIVHLAEAGTPSGALIAAVFALLLALVAQIGDLFESAVKRHTGVKDSGSLIPGHGGILDRIDGLVFAAILAALVQFSAPHY
jgi:phosphatidate cytidylyltransferase